MLLPEERVVLRLLADAYNAFRLLPVYHESDQAEFCAAIHACQNIVSSRDAVRSNPDVLSNESLSPSAAETG